MVNLHMVNPDLLRDESGISVQQKTVTEAVHPATESELIEILRDSKELITVRGGGTGLTGGCVPNHGGIILCTDKMLQVSSRTGHQTVEDHIDNVGVDSAKDLSIAVSFDRSEAIVPVGTSLCALDELLRPLNLMYLPNPTETGAFMGGMAATNASGSRSFAFGSTRDHITSLRVVLTDGDTVNVKRGEIRANTAAFSFAAESGKEYGFKIPSYRYFNGKNTAGLYVKRGMDLVDLFIGSEGILGVVSEVGIRLSERKNISTGLIFFNDEEQALTFVNLAREMRYNGNSGLISLEYYDSNALKLAQTTQILPADSVCAIQYEFFENDQIILEQIMRFYEQTDAIGGWQDSRIVEFRHSVPEAINKIIRKYGTRKLGTDFAVPPSNFPAMMAAYKTASEIFCNPGSMDNSCTSDNVHTALFGHIGDYHLHFNFIPENANEYETARKLYLLLAIETVDLKGTLSAEHGVGKKQIILNGNGTEVPYLHLMHGEGGLQEIRAIKRALDPEMRLNPGNIIKY